MYSTQIFLIFTIFIQTQITPMYNYKQFSLNKYGKRKIYTLYYIYMYMILLTIGVNILEEDHMFVFQNISRCQIILDLTVSCLHNHLPRQSMQHNQSWFIYVTYYLNIFEWLADSPLIEQTFTQVNPTSLILYFVR